MQHRLVLETPQTEKLIAALLTDADARLALDPVSGLNKYFCPPSPALALICASSCTATPISPSGFARAGEVFAAYSRAGSERQRRQVLQQNEAKIGKTLLSFFGCAGLAQVRLCPSGSDALHLAARMMAEEHPWMPVAALLPEARETGTDVPRAVAYRTADTAMEIPLRHQDGNPRAGAEILADYVAAKRGCGHSSRPVLYLTHSSKTGLIAPAPPLHWEDVVVDACQGRISLAEVQSYLRRGWPVVVSGSKFFGGPAFSGAVLIPTVRQAPPASDLPGLGTILRWSAAVAEIEAFTPAAMPKLLAERAGWVAAGVADNPDLVAIDGLLGDASETDWSAQPSIFTFAIRDTGGSLLSVAELQPIYRRLAQRGVLLGQPVSIGDFGALRIAIGARDLRMDDRHLRLFPILADVIAETRRNSR